MTVADGVDLSEHLSPYQPFAVDPQEAPQRVFRLAVVPRRAQAKLKARLDACKKHGGFYLGTIGGVAAVLSQSSIRSIECVEYPELGMEAIWKITVEDFPAFILVDDKGNDFFAKFK